MKTLFSLFAFLSLISTCFASDYYVAPNGNNSNMGTENSPWLTIQYGINQLQNADVLHVEAGIYNEKITIPVNGIQIIGEPGVILDGQGLTSQIAMIAIEDKSDILISYLEIRNNQMNDAQGISISGFCSNIEISHNQIHDIHFSANPLDTASDTTNAQPIIVLGTNPTQAISDLSIQHNTIYNCRLGYSEALAINGNVTNFVVEGNTIYDVSNIGIAIIGHEETSSDPLTDQARLGNVLHNKVYRCRSPYAACAGIYVDGAKEIIIDGNSTHENNYGIEIGCEHPGKSATDIMVRNNMIYINDYTGIHAGGYDFGGLSGKVERVKVYNNTLYKNDSLYDGNGDILISYLETGDFQNNIIFSNDQAKGIVVSDTSSGLIFNYNLYYNPFADSTELLETTAGVFNLTAFQQLGYDQNSLFADPLFGYLFGSMPDDNVFSLGNVFSSPAEDNGNPDFTEEEYGEWDFYDIGRIWQYPVDIGASETWFFSLDESELTLLELYPNPAQSSIELKNINHGEYFIFNAQGNLIKTDSLINSVIDINALCTGMYWISVISNNEKATGRFVKF